MNYTDEVILRDWSPSDAPALASNLNNPNILKNLSDALPFPYTLKHARVFIGMTNCCNTHLNKAIEYNGKLVGSISLTPQEDIWRLSAEIGFFVGEPYWGKGIITQALREMVHYAFENFEFERIYARVFEQNKSCIRALIKAGFTHEGVLRNAIIKEQKILSASLFSILRHEINI